MSISINSMEYNLLKNSNLGERIRFLRKKLMDEVDPEHFTTSSISKRTGIAAQTLTSIERGESKKPSFAVIHTLAKEFYVSIEVFTDDYYNGEEKLFSLGKPNEYNMDLSHVDLDDVESIIIGEREYFTSDLDEESKVWNHRRKISFIVMEETPFGSQKKLYEYTKTLKEIEITQMLSQLIQSVELSPYNLSSSEWINAIHRSALKEANDIVSKSYNELPNIKFSLEE